MEAFTGHVTGLAAAAINAALVVLGDKLGLWKSLSGAGLWPGSPTRGRVEQRDLREWAGAKVANGFVVYDSAADTFGG